MRPQIKRAMLLEEGSVCPADSRAFNEIQIANVAARYSKAMAKLCRPPSELPRVEVSAMSCVL